MFVKRYRLVAVGAKKPEMLSKVTQSLSKHNYEIETISSLRLGHSIVVVCLIRANVDEEVITERLNDIVNEYDLTLIVERCLKDKFVFIKSDAFIRIRGQHETGIKSYIITELIDAGLDIHGLESDTYTIDEENKFMMNIKGQAVRGLDSLLIYADKFKREGLDATVAKDWKSCLTDSIINQ